MDAKEKIIEKFMQNVYGKSPDTSDYHIKHAGSRGHWLEKQLGKKPDGKNEADFWGFECKSGTTTGKTTWGDWSANNYIFDMPNQHNINRDDFLKLFGKPNVLKNNRYSWWGEPAPSHIDKISNYGQVLKIDNSFNLNIFYNFSQDKRETKHYLIPKNFQLDGLLLAKWIGYEINNNSSKPALETKVKRKFNQKGWFKCLMENGVYNRIVFGKPISFELWINYIISGDIFFDSGMYQGNKRPYSMWRSDNRFWDKLIIAEFPKVN